MALLYRTGRISSEIKTSRNVLTKKPRFRYSRHNMESFNGLFEMKKNGYDLSECDVFPNSFTTDGHAIVCHGESIGSYTIADNTLETIKSVVQSTQLGYGVLHVPTLEEYLKTAYFIGIDVLVDVNHIGEDSKLDYVARCINKYNMQDNVIILAGSVNAISRLIQTCPRAEIYWLTSPTTSRIEAMDAIHGEHRIGFSINASAEMSTYLSNADALHQKGYLVGFWDVGTANFNAVANAYPNYIGTDMTMTRIRTAEKAWLDSIELYS